MGVMESFKIDLTPVRASVDPSSTSSLARMIAGCCTSVVSCAVSVSISESAMKLHSPKRFDLLNL